MRITFITTVDHNIGDDFVREGIKHLLREHFKNQILSFRNIHKHTPLTVRNGFEWTKNLKLGKHSFKGVILDQLLPKIKRFDKILDADIVIQSGAPVYWCHKDQFNHCSDNEWYTPLIRNRLAKNKKIKLLNIGAGSCQKNDSDGSEFLSCKKDIEYIKEFYEASAITTLRDKLSKTILNSINLDAEVIPCPSIFAVDEHNIVSIGSDFIAMNYMVGGAHYEFGQNIDKKRWERVFIELYEMVCKKHKVKIICHKKNEVEEINRLIPNADIFYSDNYKDFMIEYGKAKAGILNRVHGAFLMASLGKPSVVIGNDTRAKMVNEIGLQNYFVNDVKASDLIEKFEDLVENRLQYQVFMKNLKEESKQKYLNQFNKVFHDKME